MPGLPGERNTDYDDTTQVKSADLNDIQDQIIALADGEWDEPQVFNEGLSTAAGKDIRLGVGGFYKHDNIGKKISALGGHGTIDAHWEVNGDFAMEHDSANTGSWLIPIPMIAGERLPLVQARVKGNTTKVITLKVFKVVDGTPTQLGSDDDSALSATWQTLNVSGLTEVASGNEQFFAALVVTAVAEAVSVQGLYYETGWP